MTTQHALLIAGSWHFSAGGPYEIVAAVDKDGSVTLTLAGSAEQLIISTDDWAALVFFVAAEAEWTRPSKP